MNKALMDAIINELKMKKLVLEELVFDIYASAWFFYSVMSDKNLNKFFGELLGGNSNRLLGDKFYRNLFKSMYRTCGKNTDSKEFELFYIYNTTPPGSFLKQYANGLVDLTKEEIIEFIIRQVLMGLSIECKRQDDIIETILHLLKESKINFSEIFLRGYGNLGNDNTE